MSASASSAAILSVVRHVTANKQNKVVARLAELDQHVKKSADVLSATSNDASGSELESQVLALLKTLRKAFPSTMHKSVRLRSGNMVNFKDRLDTIERMLWETKYSPGFSDAATQAWKDELSDYLRQAEQRMAYTALFGRLTNEWAEQRFGELALASAPKPKLRQASSSTLDADDPVAVGRSEMQEQRQIWESHVTVRRETDTDKITAFLDNLFATNSNKGDTKTDDDNAPTDPRAAHLRTIRQRLHRTCKANISITPGIVESAIDAVLSADQLTSEKRRAMQDIRNRTNIIAEIVDILTIDVELSALRKRSYSETPISMQMRKAINGKYRVYLDLELLDAILIQIVGQHLAVSIRDALEGSFTNDPDEETEERIAALEEQIELPYYRREASVRDLRAKMYERVFASVRLPESMSDEGEDYDGESEPQQGLADLVNGASNKYNLRRDILRICSAEMGVQKLVYGQFCILQSDFEWFGPSMPHPTLLAIMKYFNVPVEIVEFVESFLGMHMRFQDDGPDGPTLVRKTGIPVSFQLSDGIAELLLFTLDLAVNQRTRGANLYRNHDDLWFWGQPEQCSVAWDTINEFTDIMGLRLNKEKTAFARAVDASNPRYTAVEKNVISKLPTEGKVKWGLLCFDEKAWTWTADNSAVEKHMDELRFQLKSRTSVMAYVQAYNAYVENFLPNNFCPVVTGLGDSHAIMVLRSLQHAQRYLFGDAGNVAQHVREMIRERFGKDDSRYNNVPDCFLYQSIDEGGLGLANPAPAFAKYVDVTQDDDDSSSQDDEDKLPPMERALDTVKRGLSSTYREDSTKYVNKMLKDKSKKKQKEKFRKQQKSEEEEDAVLAAGFMSFSEYVGSSEQHSGDLCTLYKTLLNEPHASDLLSADGWVSTVFGAQMDDVFGGAVAEKQLLSLQLYRTLAEEKVRWEG